MNGRFLDRDKDRVMDIPAPFDAYRDVVHEDWIDYNAHMNMGYYMVVFDFATDAWFDYLGLDRAHRDRHRITTFTVEGHINYIRELRVGAPLRFTTRLLDFDAKRIHYFHEMYHAQEGYLAATNELMTLHISEATRRSGPMHDDVLEWLAAIKARHDGLAPAPQVGRRVGLGAG